MGSEIRRGGERRLGQDLRPAPLRDAEFRARFPFGAVTLQDPNVPLAMEITGWSPFIPGDADNSSLPVAALEYRFVNPGAESVEAIFSFHAQNFMALRAWGAGTSGLEGSTSGRRRTGSCCGKVPARSGRGIRARSAWSWMIRRSRSTAPGFAAAGSIH